MALRSITHILAMNRMKDAGIQGQFAPSTGSASLISNILGGHVDVGGICTDYQVRMKEAMGYEVRSLRQDHRVRR